MKSPILPLICGVAVAAMTAAGLSHWWSLHQFISAMDVDAPFPHAPRLATSESPAPAIRSAAPADPSARQDPATTTLAPDPGQKQFYETLVTRLQSLQNQNRDLLDQLAETNRDLMKLEFRVDTHSESFRPLPVSEDQPFTNIDEDLGVLPPRAEPVVRPNYE